MNVELMFRFQKKSKSDPLFFERPPTYRVFMSYKCRECESQISDNQTVTWCYFFTTMCGPYCLNCTDFKEKEQAVYKPNQSFSMSMTYYRGSVDDFKAQEKIVSDSLRSRFDRIVEATKKHIESTGLTIEEYKEAMDRRKDEK